MYGILVTLPVCHRELTAIIRVIIYHRGFSYGIVERERAHKHIIQRQLWMRDLQYVRVANILNFDPSPLAILHLFLNPF